MGWAETAKEESYSDIECLDSIATCGTKSYYLGPRIGDAYLKVAVRILLVEYDSESLVDVYDKAARVLTGDIYTRISITPQIRFRETKTMPSARFVSSKSGESQADCFTRYD